MSKGFLMCARCGRRVQAVASVAQPLPGVPPPYMCVDPYPLVHAGFWARTGAFFIDLAILAALIFICQLVLPIFSGLLVWWLYFALFESGKWQATPGKRILGLKVTDVNGVHLRFGRASLRFIGKLLSSAIFFLGYLLAAWTPNKQALHDLIANTLVLKSR